MATLAAASGALVGLSSGAWWRHDLLVISATLFGLTACAGLVSVYRTTETLGIYSVDGQARLLEFTGGLGTFRAFRPFMLKLAAHLRIAVAARRSSRAGHLRDEMREHFRLKEAGVLSNEEYEESKMRILGAHARG
ncbi:MAG: hypothetical protein ACRETH_05165 [Steroidobacteraceae bacterium]